MSGSLASIPLATKGIDPYATMAEIADVSAKQGQAGLLGQQARAAEIQNYLATLKLGALAPALGGMTGSPSAAAPPNFLAAPNTSAPAAGQNALAVAPQLQPISPHGVMSPFGVPVPTLLGITAVMSGDPNAWQNAMKARATALHQLLAPAANAREYNGALQQAYGAGYIDGDTYNTHYQRAESPPDQWRNYRQTWLNSFQDPDTYAATQRATWEKGMQVSTATGMPEGAPGIRAGLAATAAAESGGREAGALPYVGPKAELGAAGAVAGGSDLVEVNVRNADGSVTPRQVLRRDLGKVLQDSPGSAVAPGVTGMKGALTNAIYGQESTAGANPATSVAGARGGFQIEPATFAQYAKPGEKIDNPTDNTAVGQRAIDDLWAKTGGDPMRTAVGYFSGQGNIAPPGSPNPWREDKTDGNIRTSDYVRQVMTRMLNAPAGGGAAPGITIGTGLTKPSPTQETLQKTNSAALEKDNTELTDRQTAASVAQQQQAILSNIADVATGLPTGSYGAERAALASFFKTFGGDWENKFLAATTGINPNDADAFKELAKQGLLLSGTAEKQAVGARGSLGLTNLFLATFPGIETTPQALQHMSNLMRVQSQYAVDRANASQDFYAKERYSTNVDPFSHQYQPLTALDRQFQGAKSVNAPQVYVAAAAALNSKPYSQWTRGLTPDQITSALRIARAAVPNGTVLDKNNQPFVPKAAQ